MNTPLYQKMGIFALIIVTQLSSKAQTCTDISITNTTATPTAVCAGETVSLSATLGASYQSTFTGSSATIPTEGNADPFPIPLNIVGLPTNGVTVAAVILNGLTHDSPEDLDIYLQSPAGTNIILMSDVPDNSGIDNINITLQDSGIDFPANITTGIYHPSNEIDAGPDGMPGGAALSLANFTGNYNGTWNLFMTDDNPNDGGSLSSWAIVFNVPTAASGAVSYQWASNNGTTLNNNTTATPTSAPTATTTYTVTITGIGNCTATNNVTVNVTPIPTVNDPNNQSVCENTSVTVDFNGTAGAAFDWANDNTNIGLSATGTGDISFNAADIAAQQIATITVTPSLSGCIGNPQTFSIIVNPTPTASIFVSENSNALPNGTTICSGESVTLVASGGSSYAWSGGLGTSQSVTDNTSAPSETYTVTVTDLNTCTATAAQTIQVNALPTVSISPANPVICAGINSTITATGTTATYTWAASNGGNIVSGGGTNAATINAAGTYTVTATSNGCTANASVTATAVSPPNAGTLIAGTNAFCNNNTTPINLFNLIDNEQTGGTWSVSPTPTVAGSFDDENGTFVPNGNNAGNYSFTYTVNAASPCTGSDSETVTVTLAAAPSAGTAATPLSACVNSTSGIDLFSLLSGETVGGAWTVGSGTPFGSTFNATSGTFTPNGNSVGTFTFTYTVTIAGIGNCTATNNVTVNVISIPTVNDPNNQSVCENTSVAVNFNGTAGAAFNWANDNTNIGLSATGTGNISFNAANITAQQIATITVTPSLSGCIGNPQTFNIIVNPTPTANIAVVENSNTLPNDATICSGESVTLVASGGSSYAWSGALGTSQSVTDNTSAPSETYTVTVTDLNTCTATAAQTIQVNALPTVSISPANPVICAGINSTITATGTTATYTWAASNGGNIVSGGGTNAATINAAGTYTVTATSNGCTANASVTATAVSPPNAGTVIAGTNAFCNNNTTPINLFNLIDNEQTGGNWSVSPTPTVAGSFDDENGTFVPNGNNAGNYSFTYTVDAVSPCTGSDSETVTVILTGAVSAGTAAAPLSACFNSTSGIDLFSLLSDETSGGTWSVTSGSPVGGTFNDDSGIFTPLGNSVGTFTFTYTVTGGTGCPGSDNQTVTVNLTSAPSAGTASATLSVCNNSNSPIGLFSLLSSAQFGGAWTSTSVTTGSTFNATSGTFTPLGNAVGTFTFTYTVTGGAGCAGSDSEMVTVILAGAVSAGTAAAPLSACVNSTIGIDLFSLLSGETSGGTWLVTSGSPVGGTFNDDSGIFTPLGNSVGTFAFTYTVTGSAGCPGNDNELVTIILTDAPSAGTASSALSVCNTSNSPVGLFSLLSGAQSGGVWVVASGSPFGSTFNAANGTFTPLGNAVGTFTFTYTVTGGAGCTGSDSETVTVILTGAVSAGTAAAPLSACVNSTIGINLNDLLTGETVGGAWTVGSGTPFGSTFNATSGTFTPNGNTVGTFTFTYTVTGSGGCPGIDSETVTVILTSAPSAGTAGSALSVCNTSNSPVGLFSLLSGAQSGGVWVVASGSPVSGTFSAANGTFTPLGNAVGTFTFTYTVTGGAGCTGSDSETVTVILTGAVSAGTAAAPLSACVNSTIGINLNDLLTGETVGGAWTVGSGTPFGSTFNATSGTFTPNGNTVGTFTFTYTVTGSAGCPGNDNELVTIILTDAPSAGTAGSALSVCNTSNSPVGLFSLLSGAQSGGVWTVASGSPVSGTFSAANGTFTPLGNAVGTFTFTYTVTGGAGCAGSDSETVTVILTGAVSAGTAAAPLSACVNSTIGIDLNDLLTGETVGGAWTVGSGTPFGSTFNATSGTFTPNGNTVGTFTFTYTVTGSGGCPGIDSETVTVILTSAPSAGTAGSALSVCNTSNSPVGLFSLLSGAQSGGVWVVASGSPVSGTFSAANGTFTPLGNAVGTFTFTYTVTGGAGCAGSDSETVTVILTGAVSAGIAAAPLSACVNSTIGINLFNLLSDETTGGVWTVASGSPVSGTFSAANGTFTPNGNTVGTFTFTYTVTGSGGCPGIDSETVTVILTSAPSAGTAGSALSVCNTSNSPVGLFSLLSGAQSGGVWVVASGSPVSGTFNAANGTFTPLGNAVGTFTFTYTVTGGAGCAGSDSETVTVILTGAVSAGIAAAPLSACVNSTIGIDLFSLLSGETTGGTWLVTSGSPVGGTFNDDSGIFTPLGNSVGTFAFTYTVTGSAGCPGNDNELVTIILTDAPSAGTAGSALSVCNTSNSPVGLFSLLSGAQSGGVWVVASGSPVSGTFSATNGTFTPLGNAVGTFTFTYTVTGGAGCAGSDSETVTVILTSAVSAGTAAAPLSACVNSNIGINLNDLLVGETIGGAWSVASGSPIDNSFDAVNGIFTPIGNTINTFTFTYTVTGSAGCPGSANETVTVILTSAPSAGTASSALSVCNNSNSPVGLFSLLSGAQSGGVWTVASGAPFGTTFNASSGTFTPLGNAVGTFTFTYTVTGGAGCAGSDSETVTVILTSAVSAGTAAAPLSACVNSTIGIDLFNLLSDETTGGIWTVGSGSPANGTFSAANGTFTPNGNTVGTFTFTYTVIGSGGCPGSDSETVTVILTSAPSAGNALSPPTVCFINTAAYPLFSLLNNADPNGTWIVGAGGNVPIAGTFNANNGTFIPNGNPEATYLFSYIVNGGGACNGTADTSNIGLITSSSADVCNDCPEAPTIYLKTGSDSNPILPILICTAEEQAILSYKWGAYIEHSTGEVDTIPLAILGTNSLQYYVRDICAERRWLAGDFSDAQSCPPLDTIGKQLNYFVTVDYIVQTVGCDTTALYEAKVSDWANEHNMRYLSPKPTRGNLQLTIQNEILGTLRLDICDLTGRCVYSVQLNKQSTYLEHPIDLQAIPQGIYIARIYLNDRIFLIDKITKF
jgi:subtilisin-like proprotein convertase family protein